MKTIKVIDLLNKIANKEIEDGTIFEVLGDFFYKLIVIDENLYCINTYSKQLQLVENKYIGRFINKEYEIVEIGNKIGNKIEDTPKEDKKIEKIDISKFPKRNNSLKKTALKVNEIIDYINKLEKPSITISDINGNTINFDEKIKLCGKVNGDK